MSNAGVRKSQVQGYVFQNVLIQLLVPKESYAARMGVEVSAWNQFATSLMIANTIKDYIILQI